VGPEGRRIYRRGFGKRAASERRSLGRGEPRQPLADAVRELGIAAGRLAFSVTSLRARSSVKGKLVSIDARS
jgi:hypothetical protein